MWPCLLPRLHWPLALHVAQVFWALLWEPQVVWNKKLEGFGAVTYGGKSNCKIKSPCFRLVTHRFFFPWQHVNTNRARPKSKAEHWRSTEPKNADVTGWHNFSAIAFVMRSYQSYANLSLPFPPYLEVSTQDDVGSHHFIPNLDVVRFWEQVNCSKSSPQNPTQFPIFRRCVWSGPGNTTSLIPPEAHWALSGRANSGTCPVCRHDFSAAWGGSGYWSCDHENP